MTVEPGAPPGVERLTLRFPRATPSASALPPLALLCDTRGPSGRRCELVASAAPAPSPPPGASALPASPGTSAPASPPGAGAAASAAPRP
ncbi:MAG TPA: hypothetical protein VFS43_12535 [Polyangiaceae bacterium]|nr:hypothetical protein [Polyangiaceae bacterium]